MKIDLTNLFNGSNESISVDYSLNLSNLEYSTYYPLKKDVEIKGSVFQKADVVYLDISVSFEFFGECDRCAEEITKDYCFRLNKILVPSMASDADFDDYIVVENGVLDFDELVEEEIQLFLPSKMLCSDDCKGLCAKCGKNLNFGKCDCKKDVDPRMAALLQLLDEE